MDRRDEKKDDKVWLEDDRVELLMILTFGLLVEIFVSKRVHREYIVPLMRNFGRLGQPPVKNGFRWTMTGGGRLRNGSESSELATEG